MHNKSLIKSISLLPIMMAGIYAGPVQAAEDEDILTMDEIFVTSQRRSQSLQEVPIAVSAFTEAELEVRQITETLDVLRYVPNAIASNNTGLGTSNTYFIRGLGSTETISTFDPPVGTYINDIYITRQNANNFAFFDVERIEVLRGPQGTLFGRNTTGGAINTIMKKPADEMGGFFEAGFGRYDRVSVRGSVDLPISDKLRTKFSAYYIDDDGFVDNVTTGDRLNDETSWGLYGAVQADISEDVVWDFSVSYLDSDHASVQNTIDPDTGDRITTTGQPSTGLPAGTIPGSKNGIPPGNQTETIILTSNLQVQVGEANIEFITGYVDLNQKFNVDFFPSIPVPTGGFLIVNDGDHETFTQEIKVNGTLADDKLEYVVGLYYIDEENITDFVDFSIPFGGVLFDRVLTNTTEAWAVYAQADYHITEQLTATAGIRYTDEEKTIDFAGALTTQGLIDAGVPTSLDTDVWTPRFALDYAFNDDISVFVSATRGFKSGGWNARSTSAAGAAAFDKETIWSYEIGLRSELADNTVRFNATGFFSDITDLQVLSAGETGAFLTDNFADLDIWGLEAELYWLITENFSIYSTIGLMDADYTNLDPSVVAQLADCVATGTNCNRGIVTGAGTISEPVRAPDVTWNIGFNYEIPLDALNGRIVTNANGQYTSEHFTATSNPEGAFNESRFVVNAGISYVTEDETWSLSAECTNCFGEEYATAFLFGFQYLNDPSRWDLRFKYNF